jgi:hypothetical protein
MALTVTASLQHGFGAAVVSFAIPCSASSSAYEAVSHRRQPHSVFPAGIIITTAVIAYGTRQAKCDRDELRAAIEARRQNMSRRPKKRESWNARPSLYFWGRVPEKLLFSGPFSLSSYDPRRRRVPANEFCDTLR